MVFAQHTDNSNNIDSSMAYSPDYLPTRTAPFPNIDFFPIKYQNIDTLLLHTIQHDNLWNIKNLYQSLGINGQAHKSMVFNFDRPDGLRIINMPYPLYFKKIDDLKLYNLKTSYSDIFFYYSLVDELAIRAAHAQHIRQFDYSVDIEGVTNSGYFVNQAVNRLNVNAICRYQTPNKTYGFLLSYIINHGKFAENAGLTSISDFTGRTLKDDGYSTDHSSYSVMFSKAQSKINTHNARLTNYVNFITKNNFHIGTLSHTIDFNYLKSKFTDHDLNDIFYANHYYINADSTNDSIQYYNIANTIQWSNYSPIDTIGDQNYYFRYAGGVRHIFTYAQEPYYKGNNFSVFGRVALRLFKVWDIYGKISYSFAGYTKNDAAAIVGATFNINKKHRHYLDFSFSFYRCSPDYYLSYYHGNNNYWENTFKKQNIFQAKVHWTIFGYQAGFSFYNLGQYVYLDNSFNPIQSDKQIQVIQITAYAPLRTKHFLLDAELALQHSTNKAVSVPLFTGKMSAAYITRIFRKRLNFEIGLDLFYNTKYYADGYNPILHQFYSQQYQSVGNFVYVNAHLAIRVKRISVFVRGGNLFANIFGFHYVTTPSYPMQGLNFEAGISWRFYD